MERSLLAQGQRVRVAEFELIVARRAVQNGDGSRTCPHRSDPRQLRASYLSDFGSERFLGDFSFNREISSEAQAGALTFPSRMMSRALTGFPYNFSLALPSERSVEPSREIPANNPLLRE